MVQINDVIERKVHKSTKWLSKKFEKHTMNDKFVFPRNVKCAGFPYYDDEPKFFKVKTNTISISYIKEVGDYIIVENPKTDSNDGVTIKYDDDTQYKPKGRIRIFCRFPGLPILRNINRSDFDFNPKTRTITLY